MTDLTYAEIRQVFGYLHARQIGHAWSLDKFAAPAHKWLSPMATLHALERLTGGERAAFCAVVAHADTLRPDQVAGMVGANALMLGHPDVIAAWCWHESPT